MKQWIKACTVAGLMSLMVVGVTGCGSDDQPGFVGDWVSEVDGLGLTMKANGEFAITPTDGRAPIAGTWSEAEGVIEFRNVADSPLCPDQPGTYAWAFDDDGNLVFTLVEDDCPPRIAHMTQPFDPV
jgi:hypothetical protein